MTSMAQAASDYFDDPVRRTVLLIVGSIVVATIFAFWAPLANLWHRWGYSEELSHSYFLPLVTGWMLWERLGPLRGSIGRPEPIALTGIALGLAMLIAGELIHVQLAGQIGFVILIGCLPLLLGGWSLALLCLVPVLYLFFMVPPPFWVITKLSWNFQLMSSELGVALIRLMGIPVYLAGNVIEIPSQRLEVVEACSGLRYLFPFLSLGALAAYFYKGPMWHRVAIFLSTIPITIAMNSFRIALTAFLIERVGGNHTDGFLHMFEGWMVFVLCIALLMGVIYAFTVARGEKSPLAFVGFDDVEDKAARAPFDLAAFTKLGVIATAVILVAGIIAHLAAGRMPMAPERQSFDTLTLELTEYRANRAVLDLRVEEVLDADDYIIVDLFNEEDEIYNLYIAYLGARRGTASWHSPQQCLPGGGFAIKDLDIVPVERVDGGTYHHNRFVIQRGDERFLVFYWYDQRGRKIANEFTMKLWVMWDDLWHRRSDGAMIRLMTPILAGETMEDAEERLHGVRRRIEPLLPDYIPGLDAPVQPFDPNAS